MGVREKCMPNLDSAGSLYLKFDHALKTNKKKDITLLNSLLTVGKLGLDFLSRSEWYKALSDVFCLVVKWLKEIYDR